MPPASSSSIRASAGVPPFFTISSTASATSAKASADCSWVGSLAIEGCICSKVTSVPFSAARRTSAAEKGEKSCPPAPRQRVSSHLASPSWSQMGVAGPPARITT